MINNNDRHNNEFYLAPIYNYTSKDNIVKPYEVNAENFIPVGTPEDLATYHNLFYRS